MLSNLNIKKIDPFFTLSGLFLAAMTILLAFTVNTVFSSFNKSKEINLNNTAQPLKLDIKSLDEAAARIDGKSVPALDLPH